MQNRMKITAGIGTIDDYICYAQAGADEMFAGYVPHWFRRQDKGIFSLNRREVLYYNVQLGGRSELEILSDMVRLYCKPVAITLNSLTYHPTQYSLITEVVNECMELGFCSFIIADPVLLVHLQKLPGELRAKMKIHVSGECGEVNSAMIQVMEELGCERIIFHRKNRIADMKQMTEKTRERLSNCEFEAFVMNENCQFNGSFCNTLHCDELLPACRIPYRLSKGTEERSLCSGTETVKEDAAGRSGCGFCALWRLRDAGVSWLKVVGRGNYTADMERDIRALKKALQILEESTSEEAFQEQMKAQIFPTGCSRNCYYR